MTYTLKVPAIKNDHRKGPLDAPVILVEYGDYECPHSARAYQMIQKLLKEFDGDICYVYRHFPITDIHPHAALAAMAAEAANEQSRFWDMHDLLYKNIYNLSAESITVLAEALELNIQKFLVDLEREDLIDRVRKDIDSGEESGVTGTPTFFLNGIIFEEDATYPALKESILELKKEYQDYAS
ncbi:DsbA family protein [Peredibacter sp. HCB2-198]|uniref:DsbA family protein n=1 Tax=Peredibacter sp. HCB2-198 TaxID=3383025 RepID=UPI0038B4FE49